MSKSNTPGSLSEAIANLESAGHFKADELRDHVEKDYQALQKALEDLRPLLDDVRARAESEVRATKGQVEAKVKDNPWLALGVVGLLAFVLGWIFGNNRK